MIIVFFSATRLGIYFGGSIGRRIEDLLEFKKALLIFKSDIKYSPLAEAFFNISKKTTRNVAGIFGAAAERIGAAPPTEVWQEVFLKAKTNLDDEDINYFLTFGACLGFLDKNMQENNIELFISYIDKQVGYLTAESIKSKKMWASLGALGGALACALLI
jgi:stage III sporulation protein AB